VRDFILRGGDVASYVEQRKLIILRKIPVAYGHIALAMWEGNCVKVYLQSFLGPDNPRPITYCVKIPEGLLLPSDTNGFVCHRFAYYPDGRRGRFWGQAIPLTTAG
jgi:hypothetical protein